METRDPSLRGPATFNIEESARDSLSVHWRAVFAGLFVTFLVYLMCMSLGLAFGAGAIKEAIQSDESLRGIAIGAGVWTLGSVLVALFLGSYASGRVSGIIATRVGYTQGAVITSLFFIAMLTQIGSTVGFAARGLSSLSASAVSSTLNGVARNPQLRAVIEDNISDLKIDTQPSAMNGLVTRLLRGDTDSATKFLAAQAKVSPAIAKARIDAMSDQFKIVLTQISERAASAAARLGLTAFVTILLGTLSAMLGGGTGALVNLRKPIDRVDVRALRQPAYST